MLKGIDLSHHNRNMKNPYVINQYDFIIIKATEGATYKDPAISFWLEKMENRKLKDMSMSNRVFYIFNTIFWIVVMFIVFYPLLYPFNFKSIIVSIKSFFITFMLYIIPSLARRTFSL